MEIVTDSGVDLNLDSAQQEELHIHIVPLVVSLDGTSYRDRVDLQAAEFYPRLTSSRTLPTTSQPSPGDFAETYRRLAARKEEILSIHMSSGLSGTFSSAKAGAALVPEAMVTHIDTKTLSAASGWQVEAAALAARGGWAKERILTLLRKINAASDSLFTLSELKYLIHGGRITHMKGLVASLLNIKPLIGVEKERGTYVQRGSARTFPAALAGLVGLIAAQHPSGEEMRMQVVHASNPDGARQLRDLIEKKIHCRWSATTQLSLVLSAHTGPTMVGVAFAPARAFAEVPT